MQLAQMAFIHNTTLFAPCANVTSRYTNCTNMCNAYVCENGVCQRSIKTPHHTDQESGELWSHRGMNGRSCNRFRRFEFGVVGYGN